MPSIVGGGIGRRALLAWIAGCVPPALALNPDVDWYRTPTRWLDDLGQPWQMEALRGRYSVLTLGYGACRRICSTSLRVMQDLEALAAQRGMSMDFVVVGLDPTEDKPADWRALRRDRRLTRPNWHFLSGDPAATATLAQRLGVRVWRIDSHLMHDYRIVLLSPEGRWLREVDRFDQPLETLLP